MLLIIGKRSNLSKLLYSNLENSFLISDAKEVIRIINNMNIKNDSISIIFNNFQISSKLNSFIDLDDYVDKSIYETSKILTILDKREIGINKIIYTSSSSVYGNSKFCSETDLVAPMSLQAALKVSNEELIKRFCEPRGIDYTLARVFNMYGAEDYFSIISKIKDAYINKKTLNIINEGSSIRDFVHINDVVLVYKKILNSQNNPKILNIASGNGKKVYDILQFLKMKGIEIQTINNQRDELKSSIANIKKLKEFIDTDNFVKVEDFLVKELK